MKRVRLNYEIVFMIIYKLVLDIVYKTIQVPLFGYNGFVLVGDEIRTIVGWGVFLTMCFLISDKYSDTSSLFVYVVFLISITPFITIYQYDEKCEFWMLFIQCVCLVYIRMLLKYGRKISKKKNYSLGINYSDTRLRFVVAIIIIAYFLLTLYKFGVPNFKNLLFEEVYNTRSEINLSTAQSILQNAICRIICPLSMLILFREKKWGWFSLLAMIQLYTYAVTGFKTYLFIPILLLGLQFLPALDIKKTIVIGLPIAVGLILIIYLLTKNTMFYAVLGNRVFFLPAKIKYCYFDYFSGHELVYYSQNSIAKIFGVTSNYSTNIMNLIGAVYFNKPSMWTNTGFMADAYANLGLIGMALMGTILSAVLVILYRQFWRIPKELQKVIQALFVTFYISLNDGAAISVLFSGGLLFAVLIICWVSFDEKKEKPIISVGIG